ncbi:MAG: chorismate synthase [Bacteroidetes bacterium GWF2_43_63]|nr:MAG: chorismate synthase [Bacteroidetes bacterium GWE2_42_42]OFY54897.1 MAG: chorismate synthase [Bacteroidetes bacterium GWF2_43_63]HCB63195.1 chorismate synthase [Bacteroidales bacterium]HCY22200.1 chorismate synthase [Bacteroidales bacterium]
MSAGNTFGSLLKLTLFGESHGPAVGGVLDGFPAGLEINQALIGDMLKQRAPVSVHETARREDDVVEFLSGVMNNTTSGGPVAFIIRNTGARSGDYNDLKSVFRPGHADYVSFKKYGNLPQAGGGRASGRETAARVVAGAMALDFLRSENIDIISYVSAIGAAVLKNSGQWFDEKVVFNSLLHCPDNTAEAAMQQLIDDVVLLKDSIGGKITTVVKGLPAGVGEPVFGKINAVLSQAVMSIPGAKGVDFGEGFSGISLRGSQYNDAMQPEKGKISFASNHSGGIQAGISNGNLLVMNTAFRPASSIGIKQDTVDVENNKTTVTVGGRHDACFVPRAAIVVTSMTALALMDLLLQFKSFERKF